MLFIYFFEFGLNAKKHINIYIWDSYVDCSISTMKGTSFNVWAPLGGKEMTNQMHQFSQIMDTPDHHRLMTKIP